MEEERHAMERKASESELLVNRYGIALVASYSTIAGLGLGQYGRIGLVPLCELNL
jgi:hypothetical protein